MFYAKRCVKYNKLLKAKLCLGLLLCSKDCIPIKNMYISANTRSTCILLESILGGVNINVFVAGKRLMKTKHRTKERITDKRKKARILFVNKYNNL